LLRRAAGIALVAFLVLYLSSDWWLTRIGYALIEDGQPHKADIAVVFAGDWTGSRVVRGGQLARDGYVDRVIVSGSILYYSEPESEAAINLAVSRGFPAEIFIPLPSDVMSTEMEAELLVKELRKRGVKTVLAVTSNFHTARAGRLLRKYGPELHITMIAAPFPHYEPSRWWKQREGRKIAFYEWTKTITGPLGI
jgi:uncharacterized SAM-binding protein YcdF (DUF218 family)